MLILSHREMISHFSKPRICQQHYNIIIQPTNKCTSNFSLKQGVIAPVPYRIHHLHCILVSSAGSSYSPSS